MRILGIETSCDETAVAIYGHEGLLAHVLYSQVELHNRYGGVVPELASRDHIRKLLPLVQEALGQAQLTLQDIDGIAYTKGPGLVGALLVGASFARTLGYALHIPTLGVHHMEAHLLAPLLETEQPPLPFLALLVSGGHTQLVHVQALGDYRILGETLDDAVGEAFDKTAKIMGLGYPGGKALAQLALQGQPGKFHFPRPLITRPGFDFSFSGLKTHVHKIVHNHPDNLSDIAYAFQEAVVDTLLIKVKRALQHTQLKTLVVAGGVSANTQLRAKLKELLTDLGGKVYFPPLEFCTDNGAMVALVGYLRLQSGEKDGLAIEVKPRWDLQTLGAISLQKNPLDDKN